MAQGYAELLSSLHNDNISRLGLEKIQSQLSKASEQQFPHCVFLAYLPKSSSTFLLNVLKKITLFKFSNLSWGYSQNEQNLNISSIIKHSQHDQVTRLSLKATDINLMLMHCFAIKPVILTRNIPDILVSLYDHFEAHSNQWPQLIVPHNYNSFSKKAKLDLIIDHATPWFIDFLQSWVDAEKQFSEKLLWISYEDVTQDCVGTCKKILEYYGLDFDLSLVPHYMAESKTGRNYFNKGLAGRGKTELSKGQLKRIDSFFTYYDHLRAWL